MVELKEKYKAGNAAEILKNAILAGDIPGGAEITQNEIAASLEVSRMPVREALIVLEYQGLIERLPNQHVRAVVLTDDCLRSLFFDLAFLEMESLKALPSERRNALLSIDRQMAFHRALYQDTAAPLRKKFLETLIEVYAAFVLEHSAREEEIAPVFQHARLAMRDGMLSVAKAGYAVYAEVLATEMIRIRRRKNEDAESEAG